MQPPSSRAPFFRRVAESIDAQLVYDARLGAGPCALAVEVSLRTERIAGGIAPADINAFLVAMSLLASSPRWGSTTAEGLVAPFAAYHADVTRAPRDALGPLDSVTRSLVLASACLGAETVVGLDPHELRRARVDLLHREKRPPHEHPARFALVLARRTYEDALVHLVSQREPWARVCCSQVERDTALGALELEREQRYEAFRAWARAMGQP